MRDGTMEPRLQTYYHEKVRPKLERKLGLGNVHQVPRVEKVVVNVGLGEANRNQKLLDSVVKELAIITGQKPVVRRARKSIANFSLRAGMPVGVSVTLRGRRMYEFLDRLVSATIPRIRDFRGIPRSPSTGGVTTPSGSASRSSFPRLTTMPSSACTGWISPS